MRSLQQLLMAFLGGLGVPVYLEGWVPPGAQKPYTTVEIAAERMGEKGRVRLRLLAPRTGGSACRTDWLDRLGRLIPPAGVVLAGQYVLQPAGERLLGGPGDPDGPAAAVELVLIRYV